MVTLVNETPYFTFTPLLHEVATGGVREDNVIYNLSSLCRGNSFSFLNAKVKDVDFRKKVVNTTKGKISYDFLVIALGSETNYRDVIGAEEYCYPLKSFKDAVMIRDRVIDVVNNALHSSDSVKQEMLTFVVTGAGPTGVEFAAELREFLYELEKHHPSISGKTRVIILQRGTDFLPQLRADCREEVIKRLKELDIDLRFNSEATKVTARGVYVGNEFISALTVVWTSGVKPRKIKTRPVIKEFIANETLFLNEYNSVFVIGDVASIVDANSKKVPMLAQAAVQQAKVVAQNILRKINGAKPRHFAFKQNGFLLSVGEKFAVAEIGVFHLKGFFAWWIYRTIYLIKTVGLINKIRLAWDWTIGLFRPRYVKKIVMQFKRQ